MIANSITWISTWILVAVLLWYGETITGGVAGYVALAGSIAGGFIKFFDFYLWGTWVFQNPIAAFILGERPVVHGTWKVRLISKFERDGKQIDPIECFMAIRQTFSGLSLRLMTDESSSITLSAKLQVSKDKPALVACLYQNVPKQAVRDHSTVHHGGMVLTVEGMPPGSLNGTYWTDRGTSGDIHLSERKDKVYDSFEAAAKVYGPAPEEPSETAPATP